MSSSGDEEEEEEEEGWLNTPRGRRWGWRLTTAARLAESTARRRPHLRRAGLEGREAGAAVGEGEDEEEAILASMFLALVVSL